ncbi:diaminopimelate epimerase [Bacillus alkalisoli]|uniref:diaminopimelate epimerase n=1 Tax=Bacillus alkalisoli TaxID=2011008 RepID=UPI000C24779E|nr:diaminopimelate epimerase [Bacillus alkalisoli]
MQIEFIKCHGSGNDFIMIDEKKKNYRFTEEQRVELSKSFCSRNSTIGADGILFLSKSEVADAKYRMFNPDGSEAEMCGNGLRCAARFIIDQLGKGVVQIETMKAILEVKKVDDIYDEIDTYQVEISPVSLHLQTLPMELNNKVELKDEKIEAISSDLTFTGLSVPNPHIVTIVEEYDEMYFKEVAEKANNNKDVFPKGVNVSFVKPLENSSIFVLTYERGVGFTNACGTAMSASSLVTCVLGINKINDIINVFNKGGMVQCVVNSKDDGEYIIHLIGNATYTFTAKAQIDFAQPKNFILEEKTVLQDEIDKYDKLVQFAKAQVG